MVPLVIFCDGKISFLHVPDLSVIPWVPSLSGPVPAVVSWVKKRSPINVPSSIQYCRPYSLAVVFYWRSKSTSVKESLGRFLPAPFVVFKHSDGMSYCAVEIVMSAATLKISYFKLMEKTLTLICVLKFLIFDYLNTHHSN